MRTFVGGNLGEPLAAHADEPFDALVLEVSSFQMERVDAFHPEVARAPQRHARSPRSLRELRRPTRARRATRSSCRRPTTSRWSPSATPLCLAQASARQGRVVTFGAGRRSSTSHARRASSITARASATRARASASRAATTRSTSPRRVAARRAVRPRPARHRGGPRGLPRPAAPHGARRASRGGVRCYDDSKGTNVGASVTAVRGVVEAARRAHRRRSRQGRQLRPARRRAPRARAAPLVLIGEAATAHRATRSATSCPSRVATSMDEAVRIAAELAQPGDAVLLSPACSSFDMFRDYKERGDVFVRAVRVARPTTARRREAPSDACRRTCAGSPPPIPMQLALPLDAKPIENALEEARSTSVLAALVVALIGFGVVMVYSASAVQATLHHHDPQFFLKRQAAYAVVALVAVLRPRPRRLPPALQAHVPGARRRRRSCSSRASSASGTAAAARRAGSSIGPVHVQPAEMAKLALVTLARVLAREEGRAREDVHGRLPPAPARRRRLHVPLHEAAGLRQRGRAPAPHVHDALRGGREGRLHPRRVDPRRRLRRRSRSCRSSIATSDTSRG